MFLKSRYHGRVPKYTLHFNCVLKYLKITLLKQILKSLSSSKIKYVLNSNWVSNAVANCSRLLHTHKIYHKFDTCRYKSRRCGWVKMMIQLATGFRTQLLHQFIRFIIAKDVMNFWTKFEFWLIVQDFCCVLRVENAWRQKKFNIMPVMGLGLWSCQS